LLRGFTTVRDLGGSSFSLKRAIDAGYVKGPRIFPSGATISQTSGHGDFGAPTDVPKDPARPLSYIEKSGQTIVADGVDQVLMRTREQLRQGATQIKIMAGGGVSSNYDPLDVAQYTEEEINAAVRAAAGWNTYVTVHAYTPAAVQSAIRAGVKCIDHGQLLDEVTAKIMAEKDIWWSLQPFLDDEDAVPFPEGSDSRKKQLEMVAGTDNAYKLARKYNIKTAFGSDCLFDPKLAKRQGAQLAKLVKWYTPFEVLKMATADNASLLEMSGPRNPYPKKLGVIEEGAYADLILVDGNPLENINLVANPEKNFVLIMKNGEVYKNTLQ
jgi:imidazolonepropionase-like amidohydrolase